MDEQQKQSIDNEAAAAVLARPGVRAVTRALRAAGIEGEVRVLAETAPTAAAAARQLGCPVGAIANSLVFDADGCALLVLTSGAHRVDTAALAARIGVGAIRRATTAPCSRRISAGWWPRPRRRSSRWTEWAGIRES